MCCLRTVLLLFFILVNAFVHIFSYVLKFRQISPHASLLKSVHYSQLHAQSKQEGTVLLSRKPSLRTQLLDTIEKVVNQPITAGQLSLHSGIDLLEARNQLLKLCYATQAKVQVRSDGEMVYTFRPDFRSRLFRASATDWLQGQFDRIYKYYCQWVKLVFGYGSLGLIIGSVVLLSAISSANSRSSNRSNDEKKKNNQHHRGIHSYNNNYYNYNSYSWPRYDYMNSDRNVSMSNGLLDWAKSVHHYISQVFYDVIMGDIEHMPDNRQALQSQVVVAAIIDRYGIVTAADLAPFVNPMTMPLPYKHTYHDDINTNIGTSNR